MSSYAITQQRTRSITILLALFLNLLPTVVLAHGAPVDPQTLTQKLFLPVVVSNQPLVETASEKLAGEFVVWSDQNDDVETFEIYQFTLSTEQGEQIIIEADESLKTDLTRFDQRSVTLTGRWNGQTKGLLYNGYRTRVFVAVAIEAPDVDRQESVAWDDVAEVLAAELQNSASLGPEQAGSWSPVIPWPDVAIHVSLLPNGKVLFWSADNSAGLRSRTYIWDPVTESISDYWNLNTNLFCTGHALLPDGNLLATGGHELKNGYGSKNSNIFQVATNSWLKGADMNAGRWYPTNCALGNGEMLTIGGSYFNGVSVTQNLTPQVYQADGTWRTLTNINMNSGNYPWTFLAPDGRVFYAGTKRKAGYIDITGNGAWVAGPTSHYGARNAGSAVMYDVGKILIVGGGGASATNTAEVIDLTSPAPEWRYVGSMAFKRKYVNATLLPDGTVLATGGTTRGGNDAAGAVLAAELWNPTTEQWTLLSSMKNYRLYHSNALLLPDGRVLVAGGGKPKPANGVNQPNIEIYSPTYLFKGIRPTITAAPTDMGYHQNFMVQTPDAANIAQVTLLRLGSTTHAFNQNQRINFLSFAHAEGELSIQAPVQGNLAPPGHYMLFLVDQNGVPSIGQIVKLG
jgi:hypothetical protein